VHEHDDAARIGIGERLEQHGIDNGEDSGVDSNAECESGERGESESGIVGEHAQRVLYVVPQIAHRAPRQRRLN